MEWPRLRAIRRSASRSSASTTSTLAHAQRSTSSASAPDSTAAGLPAARARPSRSSRANSASSPRAAILTASPRAARRWRGGSVASRPTSSTMARGWWKAPTRFLPSGRSMAVLPPIEESIWPTRVVGTWMNGTPRSVQRGHEAAGVAERPAADGDQRIAPLVMPPGQLPHGPLQGGERLGALAAGQEQRLDETAGRRQARRKPLPVEAPRGGLGDDRDACRGQLVEHAGHRVPGHVQAEHQLADPRGRVEERERRRGASQPPLHARRDLLGPAGRVDPRRRGVEPTARRPRGRRWRGSDRGPRGAAAAWGSAPGAAPGPRQGRRARRRGGRGRAASGCAARRPRRRPWR